MAERDVSKIKDRHPTTDLGSSETNHQKRYIAKNLLNVESIHIHPRKKIKKTKILKETKK